MICLCVVGGKKFILCLTVFVGIISLLAGMAALLHLKVVRTAESKEDNESNLLFSDVPLGQTKARIHSMDFLQDLIC